MLQSYILNFWIFWIRFLCWHFNFLFLFLHLVSSFVVSLWLVSNRAGSSVGFCRKRVLIWCKWQFFLYIGQFVIRRLWNTMIYVNNNTICLHVITKNITLHGINWSTTRNQWSKLVALSHRRMILSRIVFKKHLHYANLTHPFNHKREPSYRNVEWSGYISTRDD